MASRYIHIFRNKNGAKIKTIMAGFSSAIPVLQPHYFLNDEFLTCIGNANTTFLYMNTNTKKLISQWNKKLQNKKELSLVINNSETSNLFKTFCNEFSDIASNVSITSKKDGDAEEPYLKINQNLIFKAIPEEKILKIFLDFLTFDKTKIPQNLIDKLQNLNTPVSLKIYIAPFCPYCPKIVEDIGQLAFANKNIEVIITDGSLFSDLAEKDSVLSAPTIIFNENFRWTGSVNPDEIAEVIANIKPEDLSQEALKTIIETGKASVLADLMIEAECIFPKFYGLVTHEKWPIRLGAMVVVEELAEKKPALAEQVIAKLWDAFTDFDDSVKGDIIYLSGEADNLRNMDKIKNIITGNYSEELKEAAAEAVQSLKERFGKKK